MKINILLLIALTTTCLSCFAASTEFPINSQDWEALSCDVKVIQLANLKDAELREIMEGQHPEVAIEFSDETHFPVYFYLKGDLLNLVESNQSWGMIEVQQTFYVRCIGEELLLSYNLTDWKPFVDFITGNLSVSLCIQDGQPSIVLGAEANRRR